MKKKSSLERIASRKSGFAEKGVVTLLLRDHRAMRKLMQRINSARATQRQKFAAYGELEKLVRSHMKAEEFSLLHRIEEHKLFGDRAREGVEEHRVHELVMGNIRKLKDKEKKAIHMHIFCEILEHHLDEEEEDLFPSVRKHIALSTRKKIGADFQKKRKETAAD